MPKRRLLLFWRRRRRRNISFRAGRNTSLPEAFVPRRDDGWVRPRSAKWLTTTRDLDWPTSSSSYPIRWRPIVLRRPTTDRSVNRRRKGVGADDNKWPATEARFPLG